MYTLKKLKIPAPIVIFLGIIVVQGCDNSLDPLEEDKGLYSIYGGLNVNEEVNYMRVKKLNKPITSTAGDSLNAIVRLKNITENTSETLDFMTVTFDSIKTFNYRVTMDIEPESVYEAVVEKPDGRKVTATAETPALADTLIKPAPEERICDSFMTIDFSPVEPDEIIFVDIGFEYNGQKFWLEDLQALKTNTENIVRLSYSLPGVINRRLDPDLGPYESICDFVTSNVVTVRYRHLGKGYLLNTSTDSLNTPDEAKNLVGYYTENFSYTFK